MKLVVGLGNPGERYRGTRHNAGFRVVACLAERARIALDQPRFSGRFGEGRAAGEAIGLLLPETWMNRSGEAVAQALDELEIDEPERDLLIVLDDLDLPLGRLRLRPEGSDGGQRGLRDILRQLGSESVPRLRFGVGRPPANVDPVDWVLQPFDEEEEMLLQDAVPRAADAASCFLAEGVAPAMDRFNGPLPERVEVPPEK
ncbi:MAG: aminoacyl-tRNA hydrolase [Deltaproteobacteria bacterium]|nr:aminoacyl-tRNA hydrolase [Deltaproteobacteria bacterium]MBW2394201.1 aminoacyl-tRNA hydrolase [Deltaproteobacteria bacterium]